MKVSFFKDGLFTTGIDYNEDENCIGVTELSEEEAQELISGKDFTIELLDYEPEEITDEEINLEKEKENTKPCTVSIFEGPKWETKQIELQEQERIANENLLVQRRIDIVSELGVLKSRKDGLELLMQNTEEVDANIEALKLEYNEIKLETISE